MYVHIMIISINMYIIYYHKHSLPLSPLSFPFSMNNFVVKKEQKRKGKKIKQERYT